MEKENFKYRLMYFTLKVGVMMLEEGGETSRVEDTMIRMCRSRGLEEVYPYVTPTVVQLTSNADDNYAFSYRVTNRGIHLEKISRINQLSRDFTSKKINLDEAEKRLEEIKFIPSFTNFKKIIWAGIISGSFAILFLGDYKDLVGAFIAGIIGQIVYFYINRVSKTPYISFILSSFVIGIIAVFFSRHLLFTSVEKVISGALMPTVPGIALTNSVRDLISTDLVSGVSRLMDALIIAMVMAFGVGAGITLYGFVLKFI